VFRGVVWVRPGARAELQRFREAGQDCLEVAVWAREEGLGVGGSVDGGVVCGRTVEELCIERVVGWVEGVEEVVQGVCVVASSLEVAE